MMSSRTLKEDMMIYLKGASQDRIEDYLTDFLREGDIDNDQYDALLEWALIALNQEEKQMKELSILKETLENRLEVLEGLAEESNNDRSIKTLPQRNDLYKQIEEVKEDLKAVNRVLELMED